MLKSKRIKNDIPWWHELKVGLVGTSLVAQWLRIRLPMQGTRVRALVWEDPTCRMTTKPACHNYWACPLEPMSHNYCSPRATTTEAHVPRAPAPQQEKPPQWEALAPQWRVAPAHHNYRKRSEEHTSELQSHLNLVCRLLLEKKKVGVVIFIQGKIDFRAKNITKETEDHLLMIKG